MTAILVKIFLISNIADNIASNIEPGPTFFSLLSSSLSRPSPETVFVFCLMFENKCYNFIFFLSVRVKMSEGIIWCTLKQSHYGCRRWGICCYQEDFSYFFQISAWIWTRWLLVLCFLVYFCSSEVEVCKFHLFQSCSSCVEQRIFIFWKNGMTNVFF